MFWCVGAAKEEVDMSFDGSRTKSPADVESENSGCVGALRKGVLT